MQKRKYEMRAVDKNGDIWIVASDVHESAEAIADKFREDGYSEVQIIESK